MSNLSSYSLIDDDHIDDQETINVGNLIIDLESDLEKEKIVNEQANHNVNLENNKKYNSTSNSTNAPSSTSQNATPSSSSTSSTSSTSSATNHFINKTITTNNNNWPSSNNFVSTKECGTSTNIGTITEPDCLGPCEPGTSVTLEGIVWQETDGGILVVNVTWRGKTYVGALLDCTRHDWAPPRLCDSPASDIDAKTNKGVRSKRIVTRSNGIGLDEKNLLQTTGKLRNGKGRRIPPTNDPTCTKKQRETTDKPANETSSAQLEVNTLQANISATNSETVCVPMSLETATANNNTNNNSNNHNNNNELQDGTHESGDTPIDKTGPNSPMLISCSEPNCSKKYRNMNGLLYHQSHAHSADNASPISQDDNLGNKDAEQEPQASPPANQVNSPPMKNVEMEPRPSPPRVREDVPMNKHMDIERRPSSEYMGVPMGSDVGRKSPIANQKQHDPMNHGSSSSSSSSSRPNPSMSSKSVPHVPKQAPNPQPPLPILNEEGMKPSGTSTGPPPAPHQANCYFNPAFLANTFNPYAMPPYFPRHMYDPLTPPNIPTSNAAFLSRFMNNMRVPPPPDSPSRLLSPSMPKNVPFPPFKIDPGVLPPPPPPPHPHQIPTPHSLPNMSPMSNPPLPPMPVPPGPGLSSMPGGGPPNLRMPSQGDALLPPTSQPPFLPPAGLNPVLGMPGLGNPLGPIMPNLIEDKMAKQYRR